MYRSFVFLTLSVFTLLASGCGGKGNIFEVLAPKPTPTVTPIPPPVVVVTVSPATATVNGLKSQLFSAAVTGANTTAVTWSLSGTGCSGATCGSMASNGVYKAPAIVPSPATVIVTATSNADTTKAATATVTVLPALPVEVAVTPRSATILTNKSVSLAAVVTNTLNTGVSWTIAGSGCAGAACGTISASGVYTAPAQAPSPATLSVTAASQADPTKTDQATITVVDTPAALIAGTHTYLLNSIGSVGGFAAVGFITFKLDGTFVANEDGAFSSGASSPDIWSGTYTIDSDGRGTVTGTGLNIGTRVLRMSVLPADEIRFVQFNNAGQRASGVMRRTSATGASLTGDWAFEFTGLDPIGSPMGMIGYLQLGSGTNITGSYALEYTGGPTKGQLTGNYVPPLGGRSSVQLVGLRQTLNWAFYIVNDNELFWVMNGSSDPVITELSGRALRRSGSPFTMSSLDAAAVLSLTGNVWVSAGRLAFDGAISGSGISDSRSGSGIVNENTPFTDQYWVDSTGFGERGFNSPMCLIAPNQAFVLDFDMGWGEFSPQIGLFSARSVDGTYNFGSERPGNSRVGLATGVLTINGSILSGIADITLPGGDTAGLAVSGSITSFDPATGRGTAMLNLPGLSNAVFYVVSNGRLVLLPMAAATPGIDDIGSVIIAGR